MFLLFLLVLLLLLWRVVLLFLFSYRSPLKNSLELDSFLVLVFARHLRSRSSQRHMMLQWRHIRYGEYRPVADPPFVAGRR